MLRHGLWGFLAICALITTVPAAAPGLSHQALASSEKKIVWKDLVPKSSGLKDPLSGLTQDQRFDLETIAWVRALTDDERKLPMNSQGVEDAEKFERKFKVLGIDINKLLHDYKDWQAQVAQQQKRVVNELDGQKIRMAGYLLPLAFADGGETGFLLVPYVGACIHVPPPPPNQIVLVQLKKKFKAKDLFTPVWVSGLLRTKSSSKALTLVDGASNVTVGYHLEAEAIENYSE